jgi:hypothetical protein
MAVDEGQLALQQRGAERGPLAAGPALGQPALDAAAGLVPLPGPGESPAVQTADIRFKDLAARARHQDPLDALVAGWTRTRDRHDAMVTLQRSGVPAGVCQTAGDRCDHDPQLKALEWLTDVTGSKIGRWPSPRSPSS